MFDKTSKDKVKTGKFNCGEPSWVISITVFTIARENLNVVPDSLSRRQVAASTFSRDLEDIHKKLGHPGITRLVHCVRTTPVRFSVQRPINC